VTSIAVANLLTNVSVTSRIARLILATRI